MHAAEWIYQKLSNIKDLQIWMDKKSLLPGQNWQIEIPKAISNSDCVILLLSNNMVTKRGYVQKEIRLCFDTLDQMPEGRIFLIPVRLNNCEPEFDKLKALHYVDLFPDWQDGLLKILSALKLIYPQESKSTINNALSPIPDFGIPSKFKFHNKKVPVSGLIVLVIVIFSFLIIIFYFLRIQLIKLNQLSTIIDKNLTYSVSMLDSLEPSIRSQKQGKRVIQVPKIHQNLQFEPTVTLNDFSKKSDILDSLNKIYETTDLEQVIEKEFEIKHYNVVLKLYDLFPPERIVNQKIQILRIRALRYLNETTILHKILFETQLDDGEFSLEKARMMYNKGNIEYCLKLLGECNRTPAKYIDNRLYRLEYLYLTARCKSAIFDQVANIKNKNDALDSWFDVKSELQTAQDHSYFKDADMEMMRITSKTVASQR